MSVTPKLDEEISIIGDHWCTVSITLRLRDVVDVAEARQFVESVQACGRRIHHDLITPAELRQSAPEAFAREDRPDTRPADPPLQETTLVSTSASLADHPATPPDSFPRVGRELTIDEIRSIDDRAIVADGDEVTEDHVPDARIFRKGESWDISEDLVIIERDSPSEALLHYRTRFPNSLRTDGSIHTRWYGLTALITNGGFNLDDIVEYVPLNKKGKILKFNKYVPGEALVSFLDGPGIVWAGIDESLRIVGGNG